MKFYWKILEKNKRIKITKIKEKRIKQKIIIDYFLLTKWLKLNKKYIEENGNKNQELKREIESKEKEKVRISERCAEKCPKKIIHKQN